MITTRIEVREKECIFDAVGEGVRKDIADLGISGVTGVSFIQVYYLFSGCRIAKKDLKRICVDLLVDKVTQTYAMGRPFAARTGKSLHVVEIAYNPGVMDPVEESALKGIRDLGITGVTGVHTGKKYILRGRVTGRQIDVISEKLLFNKVIQHRVHARETDVAGEVSPYVFRKICVPVRGASVRELMNINKRMHLFLNAGEMKAIQKYYGKLGRNPTDCELESLAQTWSEHCKHKTLRGTISYRGKLIRNLLKSTIMRVTDKLAKPWCVSVFKDNSGIIEFDDKYDVCFKVETHNHPSALEPYGGAGTGIGGVIRDPLGTGLGAKPILNTDVFCFGPLDTPLGSVPKGTLHPKRVMKGVVSGVRDYGNRMGIPTCNGAVLFDEGFIGNPLVYCGNVGLIPKNMSEKRVDPGDVIMVVGGRTGRDGIHGATFSSGELTEESESVSGQAVQIGNPITEKKVADTIIEARDKALYKAITDCGAGGLSSAVGEMGEKCGAEVYLDRVPLKYEGLSYTEIWISEAQERMVLGVSPRKVERLLNLFSAEGVEATVIGRFTDSGRLRLFYKDEIVADMDMGFLHDGLPNIKRKAVWKRKRYSEPRGKCPPDLTIYLKRILSDWNVCSKEWVIRQYDHEVQGASVLKPLQGPMCDGPGDAAVMRPILGSRKGIAVSNGINFRYGFIDPYWMAASCIDEALRQIIAVGGSLDRIALLDNFCWGNTDRPGTLGSLVRASLACYDIATVYGVPFISGKESLNNEYKTRKGVISIPPTLLISAIGIIDNVEHVISMDLKAPHNLLYAVGITYPEMGGSHYLKARGHVGNSVPGVNAKTGRVMMNKLSRAIKAKSVISCHDCSEGGIGVAISEMAFAGGVGVDISLKGLPVNGKVDRNDIALFSESNTRFIAEVPKSKRQIFEKAMKGQPIGLIGETKSSRMLRIEGLKGEVAVYAHLDELKAAWQGPFKEW
ncbi:MAG: phosphoribosylformylglycinamidine synthase subunit PurL [Candidatus Omnitrophota bacterium]